MHEFKEKIKAWGEAHEKDIFLVAVAVLLSAIFFGAGRLWFTGFYEFAYRSGRVEPRLFGGQAREIVINEDAFPVLHNPKQGLGHARFMASINGEKYYPAGCKAASRIKKENAIWFSSEQEAHEMGYTPSSQCKK